MPAKKSVKRKKPANKIVATAPAKKKKSVVRPRTAEQYFAQPEAKQEKWNRVVQVPTRMRSGKISLRKASDEFGVDPKTVKALVGSALRKLPNGRYIAKPKDNLLRVLVIPGPKGLQEVVVKGSETARGIAAYSDAVQRYLQTGDSSRLKKWKRTKLFDESGKRIKLIADPVKLRELGSAGVLSFESLYRRAA